MAERVIPIFREIEITKEEGILLLLIVCFTPCIDCSDEGRPVIRQARSKYINILKSYHQEKFLDMADEEKIRRFRLLLEFLTHLQVFLFQAILVTALGLGYSCICLFRFPSFK